MVKIALCANVAIYILTFDSIAANSDEENCLAWDDCQRTLFSKINYGSDFVGGMSETRSVFHNRVILKSGLTKKVVFYHFCEFR